MFLSVVVKSFPKAVLARILNVVGAGSINHINRQDDFPFWVEQDQIA
jgi:hypothetical protein